jgi:NAD(P)-dependent dehydrogenase (short-subunit alcohol dehydrogenase family)
MLVTGATDGIGKQTALELVRKGAPVVVHGRHQERIDRVVEELRAAVPGAKVDGALGDLSSLEAVRALGASVAERFPGLGVLVNNAGVFMKERRTTVDGFEMTFAVNHLAPFLLTRLLLPVLERGGHGRIITVSSVAHSRGAIPFDDLQRTGRYDGYNAYAQSKLANVLFTQELARRLDASRVTANSLHPGVIHTKLLFEGFGMTRAGELTEGAATSVFLATSPDVEHVTGKYFDRSVVARQTVDDAAARRLWEVSSRLVGLP